MTKRYGVPYQGSKNSIARKIIDFLPSGTSLVDLFAGGCAITHAALEQMSEILPKWERVICNDINPLPTELFHKSINGEMRSEKRWISREDFHRLKGGKDAYVTLCWSFSNNQQDYLYGRHLEPWKKAMHYARVLDDWSLITDIVGKLPREAHDNLRLYVRQNHESIRDRYRAWYEREAGGGQDGACLANKCMWELQSLESLERLQRLQSLESLERLEIANLDYADVPIPDGAVIYCDIPYEGRDCKGYEGFDHKRFFNWAAKQRNIYISSYEITDPRFECVWSEKKYQLSTGTGSGKKVDERIYTVK